MLTVCLLQRYEWTFEVACTIVLRPRLTSIPSLLKRTTKKMIRTRGPAKPVHLRRRSKKCSINLSLSSSSRKTCHRIFPALCGSLQGRWTISRSFFMLFYYVFSTASTFYLSNTFCLFYEVPFLFIVLHDKNLVNGFFLDGFFRYLAGIVEEN